MVMEKKQGAGSLSLPGVGLHHLPSYISKLLKEKLDVLRQDSMLQFVSINLDDGPKYVPNISLPNKVTV